MTAPAYDYYADDEEVDAREDLGYRGSREAEPDDLDEREVAPPAPAAARTGIVAPVAPSLGGVRGDCRRCPAIDVMLYQRPDDAARTLCMSCSGDMYREVVESTRDCIRGLKAAAATGDSHEERVQIERLRFLVGVHQAEQTVAAIRAKLAGDDTGRGGRR